MNKLFNSVAFRFAMGYGALMIGAVAVVSAAVYFGTVGVVVREIDRKIMRNAEGLIS